MRILTLMQGLPGSGAPPIGHVLRCVMEAGHPPVADTLSGHNFDGIGPFTPTEADAIARRQETIKEYEETPLCVAYEGHHWQKTSCDRCWPYFNDRFEKQAKREWCGNEHAHEAHGWINPTDARWCVGRSQCLASQGAESERDLALKVNARGAEMLKRYRKDIALLRAALADAVAVFPPQESRREVSRGLQVRSQWLSVETVDAWADVLKQTGGTDGRL